MSSLIRTITDKVVLPGDVLYIDPDNTQIEGDVFYSVQLEINDDNLGKLEYNTIYEETLTVDNLGPEFVSGSGTNGSLYGEPLEDITVTLYQRPPSVGIVIPKKTKVNTSTHWKLPNDYDAQNIYAYEWVISELTGQEPVAEIHGDNTKKHVNINILQTGLMRLLCKISRQLTDGSYGCPFIASVLLQVGFNLESVVISRNRYT